MAKVTIRILCLATFIALVHSHGRLIRPPSRSSMWRFGFNNPTNYNDNQLWCGGAQVQHQRNGGRCGVCGDPYDGPRENEAGGRYANGIIVETYMKGSPLEIDVEITANHQGWFEFRLCPHNDISTPVTQECLNRYLLAEDGTGETRKYIGSKSGIISFFMILPADVTCTQCVLQWKYHTGNNWGTDPETGLGCLGCGDQEEFYGCADIAITETGEWMSVTGGSTPYTTTMTTTTSRWETQEDQSSNGGTVTYWETCRATGAWTGQASMDAWCRLNCPLDNCPSSHCICTVTEEPRSLSTTAPSENENQFEGSQYLSQSYDSGLLYVCQAIGAWEGQENMDSWCVDNCMAGFCPESMCACASAGPQDDGGFVDQGTSQEGACQEYVAVGLLEGVAFADQYCHLACKTGACPVDVCACIDGGNERYSECFAVDDLLRERPGMDAFCQIMCLDGSCPPPCTCLN